jgi:hypothetical protein
MSLHCDLKAILPNLTEENLSNKFLEKNEAYILSSIHLPISLTLFILSLAGMTIDGIWVGEYIYRLLTARNHKEL